jgi:hypothetical protein
LLSKTTLKVENRSILLTTIITNGSILIYSYTHKKPHHCKINRYIHRSAPESKISHIISLKLEYFPVFIHPTIYREWQNIRVLLMVIIILKSNIYAICIFSSLPKKTRNNELQWYILYLYIGIYPRTVATVACQFFEQTP